MWIQPSSDFNSELQLFSNDGGSVSLTAGSSNTFLFSDGTSVSATSPVVAGRWYFLTITSDGTTKKLYVNGTLEGSGSANRGLAAGPTYLGSLSGSSKFYSGVMDETAIWAKALSASEVQALYRRGSNRLQLQVRSCSDATCTAGVPAWHGPDNSASSYFSELYNSVSNTLGGTIQSTLPLMSFSNFASLSVSNNRYAQYRLVIESEDQTTSCNYGGSSIWCSPEVRSVLFGPTHYDKTSPTVISNIGVSYTTLSGFSETLGSGSCSSGALYNLSKDGSSWYYWNGSTWSAADGTTTKANNATTVNAHISTFPSAVGTGTLYFKVFLTSDGASACEVASIRATGAD
jgi:hypothetical protein